MAFQKYQGEQVQQIPAGYVEAMGSMGKAYQNIGTSLAAGIMEKDKREQEEAKLQGALSPYLRNDPRNKSVESALSTGLLKKDAEGNVIIPEENKGKLDLNIATNAIDFYNKTGGDGTKLKGADLTRFATQFESEQKYEATQAAKEDKRIERLKTLAEIKKLEADAKAKANEGAAADVVAGYAAGTPLDSPSAVPAARLNLPTVSAPTYDYTSPTQTGALGSTYAMPGFSVDRYNAGTELTGQLRTAPTEPTPVVSTTPATVPAAPATTQAAPGKATIPIPNIPVGQTIETIKAAEAERVVLTQRYQTAQSDANTEHSRRMLALQRTGGATPEAIKQMNEVLKIKMENLASQYKANVDIVDKSIASVTTIASENRAEKGQVLAEKADVRAEKGQVLAEKGDVRSEAQLTLAKEAAERAVAEGKMTKEKFELEFGTPIGSKPDVLDSSKLKPGTFARAQALEREKASGVPGRTGGSYSREQEQKVSDRQNEMKEKYPANWGLGVFHDGAKQYQFDLVRFPSATGLKGASVGKVQETLEGYSEAQTYLMSLMDVVQSTDDNAITNYLNRSLWTAKESAKGTTITGDMLNQFGVAAFRRAIVSGGNFSDADREYVAKLITDINSAHLKKDKALMIEQTNALAKFIDSKYKAGLTSNNVRFDTKTAREFLTREGDAAGLQQLDKTEQYVRTFRLDEGRPSITAGADYPQRMLKAIENAKAVGNERLARELTTQRDAYLAELDRKAEAAKAAQRNANK